MIQQRLIKYIAEEIHMMEANTLTPEKDLLEGDLLDSMSVMRLIGFIEDEFAVKITLPELTVENFNTVNSIAALIDKKSQLN